MDPIPGRRGQPKPAEDHPPVQTADDFFACARKSRLFDDAALAAYEQSLRSANPRLKDVRELAGRMVKDGMLTEFQAKSLLRGKWRGFLIGGKYRVLELLGTGGMGTVFLCEHVRMRRAVALKLLAPERLSDPSALERFDREARASSALAHPNIVRATDVDQDDRYHYLVMEYVRGTSLQALVHQHGPLSPIRAADYVRQAALGLQYAHTVGLVHRDIKPGNLLLNAEGTVKVLDLGLARFHHDTKDKLTEKYDGGSILGTADYLSPEQAVNSHEVTIRSDIYSLGATFYYLLTGKPPFHEGTLAQKMIWHQIRQPPKLTESRKDVPAAMEAVLLRMMAKEPGDRYREPAEVADALAPWCRERLSPPSDAELPPLSPAVRKLLAADASPSARIEPPPLPRKPTPAPASRVAPPPAPAHRRWLLAVTAAGVGVLGIGGAVWLGVPFLSDTPTGLKRPDPRDLPDPLTGVNLDRPIDAKDAHGRMGQKCTVRLTVKQKFEDRDNIYLYSKVDPTQPDNFTIIIPKSPDVTARFREAKVADPLSYFDGEGVEVTGFVRAFQGASKPAIEVTDPAQIRDLRQAPPATRKAP